MADPESSPEDREAEAQAGERTATAGGEADGSDSTAEDIEALRQEVDEKYDFENFGPEDMAEMSAEEWEAAFDPDTWITGEELLDRVEADVKHRVAIRDVFARVERLRDGNLVAYSDEGYALVQPDGSVEGVGTVVRDVKPVVALCSMEDYDVPEMPEGEVLPEPEDVPEGTGELGNRVLQVIAAVQVLAGLGLLVAGVGFLSGLLGSPGGDVNLSLLVVAGVGFLIIGVVLFMVVANARLSDRFRAEEFRGRLRAVGVEEGEYPDFLPVENGRWVGDEGGELPDGSAGDRTTDEGAETAE